MNVQAEGVRSENALENCTLRSSKIRVGFSLTILEFVEEGGFRPSFVDKMPDGGYYALLCRDAMSRCYITIACGSSLLISCSQGYA
ncbi:MAG: hypothetical protein MUE44_27160 [Oscillatoriaceae cyanobacterium Prado104]|jgi:hypothetical protein|nr:hypothetical protein [Oscillatoriaceae cyanobacterium Prado104]